MKDRSYLGEIIDEISGKRMSEAEFKETILKRVVSGYSIISNEISKDAAKRDYLNKGIRP